MRTHYIYDFVRDSGDYELDYTSTSTLYSLTSYIENNYDTSDWDKCDFVRVCIDDSCSNSWYDTQGLFIWDGSKVVYPYYNGNPKNYSNDSYSINYNVCCDGFIPNTFDAIYDYDIHELDDISDGLSNKICFAKLSYYKNDIISNMREYGVSNSYSDRITVSQFVYCGRSFMIIFLGSSNGNVLNYFNESRPYDANVESAFEEYDVNCSVQDVIDSVDSGYSDRIFFIRPEYFRVDFRSKNSNNRLSQYSNSRSNVKNVTKEQASMYAVTVSQKCKKSKCQGVKSNGQGCSRMAKNGYSYCGIHIKYN